MIFLEEKNISGELYLIIQKEQNPETSDILLFDKL